MCRYFDFPKEVGIYKFWLLSGTEDELSFSNSISFRHKREDVISIEPWWSRTSSRIIKYNLESCFPRNRILTSTAHKMNGFMSTLLDRRSHFCLFFGIYKNFYNTVVLLPGFKKWTADRYFIIISMLSLSKIFKYLGSIFDGLRANSWCKIDTLLGQNCIFRRVCFSIKKPPFFYRFGLSVKEWSDIG